MIYMESLWPTKLTNSEVGGRRRSQDVFPFSGKGKHVTVGGPKLSRVTLSLDPKHALTTSDNGRNSARGPTCVLHPVAGRCPSATNRSRFLRIFDWREQNKDDLAYHMTAHLRLNAVYWGLTALCIMNRKDALDREETIDFVLSCWDDEAGGAFYVYLTPPSPAPSLTHCLQAHSEVIRTTMPTCCQP